MDRFPLTAFMPTGFFPRLEGAAQSSGRTASGLMPAPRFDGGPFWTVEGTFSLRTDALMRQWKQWEALLDGGSTPVIMPFLVTRLRPAGAAPILSTWDDGTIFDDGTRWTQPGTLTVTADAAEPGAAVVDASVSGGEILPGDEFEINHPVEGPRCYRIARMQSLGSGVARLTLRPLLRAAISAGTVFNFEDPACVMTLQPASARGFAFEDRGDRAFPSVKAVFVEHFDAPAVEL